MGDPQNSAAEAILRTVLEAQREGGDVALCDALDLLAEGTGQNKFRHAASVLRGTKLGRRAIDDKVSLRRIAAFPPARRHEAVGIVARQEAGAAASKRKVDTIAHRLREKLRKNAEELVISATSICNKDE
jgi:hypothetical protein